MLLCTMAADSSPFTPCAVERELSVSVPCPGRGCAPMFSTPRPGASPAPSPQRTDHGPAHQPRPLTPSPGAPHASHRAPGPRALSFPGSVTRTPEQSPGCSSARARPAPRPQPLLSREPRPPGPSAGVAQPKPAPRDYGKGCHETAGSGLTPRRAKAQDFIDEPHRVAKRLSTGTDLGITCPSVRQVGPYISRSRLLSLKSSFGQPRPLTSRVEILLPVGLSLLLRPNLFIYLPAPPLPHQASAYSQLMSSSHQG